jgi:hypothetical protein
VIDLDAKTYADELDEGWTQHPPPEVEPADDAPTIRPPVLDDLDETRPCRPSRNIPSAPTPSEFDISDAETTKIRVP